MDLEKAGIQYDSRIGITVNDNLRTSNKNVYAAGDCCSSFKFTHAADFMARLVIRNALFFGSDKMSKLLIPYATFTEPEIASVGLCEFIVKNANFRLPHNKLFLNDSLTSSHLSF